MNVFDTATVGNIIGCAMFRQLFHLTVCCNAQNPLHNTHVTPQLPHRWETTQHNRHSGLLTKINSSSVHALSMMTGLAFAIKSLSVPLTDLTNIVISVH